MTEIFELAICTNFKYFLEILIFLPGGKYVVLSNGDLHINNAGPSDGYKSYACRTINRLTGEIHTSAYPGRVIITEPKGSVQPRVTVEKHAVRHVTLGDDVTLPCVAQGYPVPTYRYVIQYNTKHKKFSVF